MKALPTNQSSEVVKLTNKKYPPSLIKRWCEVANRPMIKLSSHNPWIIAETLAAEFGIQITMKLTSYTQGADSTRWYKATYAA